MRGFYLNDGARPGKRIPAGEYGTEPNGIGSQVLNEAQAVKYRGYTPTIAPTGLPEKTVLFMPLTEDLSMVLPANRPLIASTPYMAGRTAPNGKGSTRIGAAGRGCGWRINAPDIVDIGSGDFTISWWAWLPFESNNRSSSILTTQSASPYNWTLQYYQYLTGKIYISCGGADIYLVSDLTNFYDSWHHYAWTRKNGISRFFIDGVKQSEFAMANFTSNTTTLESGLWGLLFTPVDTQQLLVSKAALWDADFTPPDFL